MLGRLQRRKRRREGGEDDDGGAAATKRRGACDSCGSFQRRVDEETGEEVCDSCGEVLVQANRTAVESSNLDRREQHFDDVVLGSRVRHVQRKGMSAQIIIQEQTRKLKKEERARAVSKYRKAVERKRKRKIAGLPPLARGLPRRPDEVLSGPGSLPSKVIVENQPLGARKLRHDHYRIATAAAKQVAIVPTAVRVEEGAIANLRINTTDVPVDLTNYVGRSPFRTSKVGVFSATGQFLTRADVQDAYERVLRRLLNSAVISAHQFLGLDARTLHIESHSLLTRYLYRVFNDSDVSRLCMNLPTSEISYLSEKAKDKPRVKFIVTPRSIIAAILVWFACNRKGLGALFDDFAALYDAGHLGSPGTSTETLDLLPPGGRPGFVRAQSFSPAIVNKLQAYLGIKLPSVNVCVREHKIYLPPLYRLAVRLRLANIRTLWPILTGILLSMLNIPEESALRRGHFEASLLTHQGLCALIIFAFSTLGRSHWARLRKGWNPSHPILGGHHDDLCTLNIDRLSHPRHAVRLHEQILHWRNTRFHCQGRTLLHELTPELDALRDITQEEAKVQSEASIRKPASQSHADDGSSDSNFGDDSSDAQSSRGADSDGHHRGQGPSSGNRLVEDESEFAAIAQSLAPKNADALEDLRVDRYLSRLPYTEVFQDLDDHLFRAARMWRAIVRTLDAPRPSFRDNLAATPLRSVLDQFEERYHAEIQLLADVAQVMHFAGTNRLALYLRRLAKSFDRFARNNTDISAGRDLSNSETRRFLRNAIREITPAPRRSAGDKPVRSRFRTLKRYRVPGSKPSEKERRRKAREAKKREDEEPDSSSTDSSSSTDVGVLSGAFVSGDETNVAAKLASSSESLANKRVTRSKKDGERGKAPKGGRPKSQSFSSLTSSSSSSSCSSFGSFSSSLSLKIERKKQTGQEESIFELN